MATFQITLRKCSEEVEGNVRVNVILVKGRGAGNQAHIATEVTASLMKVTANQEEQVSP